MAAELHQAGSHVDYTPGSAVVAGAIVNLGGTNNDLVGVVNNDIGAGEKGSCCIGGVYKVSKKDSLVLNVGDAAGYDVSEDEAVSLEGTPDANSDMALGTVVYAAAADDEYVYVLVNGLNI